MDPSRLDTLDLDTDIGSPEGLSVDQLTRSRLQFLLGQNDTLVRQMQFADTKAGTLLAMVGVLALVVAEQELGTGTYLVASHYGLTLVVTVLCLVALVPRIPGAKASDAMGETNLFSWPAIGSRKWGSERYAGFMRTSQASQLVMSIAAANVAMARILRTKYLWLRAALCLALVDLVVLVSGMGLLSVRAGG